MNIILIAVLMIILLIIAWLLFSSRNEEITAKTAEIKKPDESEPEKILRRRASDRAIEQEFPEEPESGIDPERIRKSDSSGVFELPYSANEIIPDNSRFKLYKRTLINSEIYAIKGDYETAISLFKGVKDRISDFDVRNKIESNIEYLNHFRKRREEDVKKKMESLYSSPQPGELRLKIDGPVPQTINIGLPEKNINADDIIEKISEQISNQLLNVKDEIEKLKSETEEKLLTDDSEEILNLQTELNNLKEMFTELDNDKKRTLEELNKLRQTREDELKLLNDREKDRIRDELLSQIKNEMSGFSDLKNTLDKLNEKIEDLNNFKIPESSNEPRIVHAKYEAPIPVHFDPEPVLEILDRISRQGEKIKEEEPAPEIPDETDDKAFSEEAELIPETDESLPPEDYGAEIPTADEPELIEETTADAEELHEIPETDTPAENEPEEEPAEELAEEPDEETAEEVILEPERAEEPVNDEILLEKEKEIEKHKDAEEDPNDFDLLSEYGQVKDDSTLSDEDIFEKILKDDNTKEDDSAFEIIGDFHKDETEYSLDDTEMDEKKKAEHDFYKKFIKPDRIKKKELPILKVSYDFKKLPDEFSLSREKNILEYSFYKYKPMLVRADEFIKQRRVKDAINYYRVVLDQNIPIEFKIMIKKNIHDLTEYLEKYLGAE